MWCVVVCCVVVCCVVVGGGAVVVAADVVCRFFVDCVKVATVPGVELDGRVIE